MFLLEKKCVLSFGVEEVCLVSFHFLVLLFFEGGGKGFNFCAVALFVVILESLCLTVFNFFVSFGGDSAVAVVPLFVEFTVAFSCIAGALVLLPLSEDLKSLNSVVRFRKYSF